MYSFVQGLDPWYKAAHEIVVWPDAIKKVNPTMAETARPHFGFIRLPQRLNALVSKQHLVIRSVVERAKNSQCAHRLSSDCVVKVQNNRNHRPPYAVEGGEH